MSPITERRPGVMDNPYYDWSPLPQRPRLKWPDGAHVAVCVLLGLHQIEWMPGADTVVPPSVARFSTTATVSPFLSLDSRTEGMTPDFGAAGAGGCSCAETVAVLKSPARTNSDPAAARKVKFPGR